jgi:hypothetical protein
LADLYNVAAMGIIISFFTALTGEAEKGRVQDCHKIKIIIFLMNLFFVEFMQFLKKPLQLYELNMTNSII